MSDKEENRRLEDVEEFKRYHHNPIVKQLNDRIAELERQITALKSDPNLHCPNCDKLRLENGELRHGLDRAEDDLTERDKDWVLAIGSALGLESGFDVPIVPKPGVFKKLFKQIETKHIADLERQLADQEKASRYIEAEINECLESDDPVNDLSVLARSVAAHAAGLRKDKNALERQVKKEHGDTYLEALKRVEAERQLADARRDAERYRWLRERLLALDNTYESDRPVLIFLVPKESRWSMNLDASIDAAIQGGESE